MAHTVITRSRARIDIRRTVTRIAQDCSHASAARWYTGILRRIRSLAVHPEMWPLAEEAEELGIELRQALFGRRRHVYRILFTIENDTVHIHRVRHAAQDRLTEDDI